RAEINYKTSWGKFSLFVVAAFFHHTLQLDSG
ncbi:MAG: hypothetical protein ACI90V_011924, partial [Bacillariaceae sp.]